MQADAVSANPTAARRISQTLLTGPSPTVVVAGLDALAVLGRPEGAPAVLRYMRHRRASIRRHAVAAARAIHSPELLRALIAAIGDPAPDVRTDVVTALSEIGGHGSVALLFTALQRDLDDATRPEGGPLTMPSAVGIGRFGAPDDVRRLLGMLGRAPFGAITAAMRVALRREDLPEPVRLEVVTSIGRLATHDARTFLDGFLADAHGHDDAVVREARAASERIAE
jgi:HEAT repeat protein